MIEIQIGRESRREGGIEEREVERKRERGKDRE